MAEDRDLLKALVKEALEEMLEAEMTDLSLRTVMVWPSTEGFKSTSAIDLIL